ncbi:hypothetical protein KC614_00755 [candidate division WWE3 bacterium]|uniref:Uncharacterized protein n=1 Tax=candidate division WWE3 bacterium TaxID=2053526 RepID=A0A955RQR2_UNCKA|nr:hypothetical protein [candidate division WWE3 bacterium]
MNSRVNKRGLALLSIFLLATQLIFVVSRRVNATVVQSSSSTVTRHKESTSAGYILTFQLSASESLDAGETVIVDFHEDDSGFTLDGASLAAADIDFNDGTERTVVASSCSADEVEFSAVDATGIVTFTLCAGSTGSSTGATITVEIGDTAAGPGTNRLTNPTGTTPFSSEINVSGSFGDDAFATDVPIVDDDQVTINAQVDTFVTFDLDVSDGSHSDTDDPYSIDLGELVYSSVTDESTSGVSEIYLDIDTNADGGAIVQVLSANGNLSSSISGDNIPSNTGALTTGTANGNYGIGASENAAATEGALTVESPYNVSSPNVGAVSNLSFQPLFNTGAAPIVGGDGEVDVRAISGISTSAATDYTDTLTFRATATF